MSLKRHLFYIVFLVLVSSVGAVAQGGWVVTPGDGVGAITVGMSPSAAEAVLQPSRWFGPKTNPNAVEYGPSLFIEYDSNRAVMISLHANSFPTRNGTVSWTPFKGAAIGTAWNAVASQLGGRKVSKNLPTAKGQPAEVYHAYPDVGVGFRVKGGVISRVDLWKGK
jgi:hypothetical protein